ncbi:hypothetical protein CH275_16050 [Rhodococcus sp. 06-235-1A]|uniref:SGNH/GDSL hydrolase family protein n=1 Tax=Rhodococcus sp. 06-235-1A TaxID=2022508 RepID=UPI000B9BAA19|nr:SGNH/GDSL hydrolase family protein [Rhodococcus sp. 06-235-1A]OZD03902.1 hypothetical protein CH275_16050 [Rhodococcus sp. 06-235-1A]
MGILDAPGVSQTKVDTTVLAESTITPRLAAFHRLMKRKVRDVHFLVLSDSTGAGPTRFPRLLANYFAAAYPDWTIIWAPWDDATKTYPVGNRVTVQTGTSGRTLTIWNGSVSGEVINYASGNRDALTAGFTPDIIYFNYMHNSPQVGDAYRAITVPIYNLYINNFPGACVIVGTQNPRATTDAAYDRGQTNNQVNFEMAAVLSLTCVDVNAMFLDYNGNYATDLLLPDGLHPNDSVGSPLWAATIWETIKPGRRSARVSPPVGMPTRVWVPAASFTALDGTPQLGNYGGIPAWALDPAVTESIVAVIDFPPSWRTISINGFWMTDAAQSGNARIIGSHQYLGNRNGITSSLNLGTWADSGSSTQSLPNAAKRTTVGSIWDRTSLGGFPMALKIARLGADALDTMPADALFLGLQVIQSY